MGARQPADEVLQEINGCTVADRKLVDGYTKLQGRRVHGLRLLDLFRLLQGWRQPDRAPQTGEEQNWVAAGMGLGVAA